MFVIRIPKLYRGERGFTSIEMLTVAATVAVLAAMTAPLVNNMLSAYRLSGDARSVANQVAVAKMRASSLYTNTRFYADLAAQQYHIDIWQKGGAGWTLEGASTSLADSFGVGVAATPPPNTQAAIAQAAACTTNGGAAIGNTACVVFNSRGLPVDATGTPTGANAFYITNGQTLYGITISATGMTRVWRSKNAAAPSWVLQ